MKTHRFNYPPALVPCQFCTPDPDDNGMRAAQVPTLNAAIIRMPDGRMSTAFNLECTNCGYKTKEYEYPDIVCHAWNMASKLSVNELVDDVTAAYNGTIPDKKEE
jgi:hypothetical protein